MMIFDESKWVKANPLIDANPYLCFLAIRKEAVEGKAKKCRQNLPKFKIKRLTDKAATAGGGWIDLIRMEVVFWSC